MMALDPRYGVVVQSSRPRAIAAVHARVAVQRVPAVFATYLDQVYAAARDGAIAVDGQNIFLYTDCSEREVDVEFGVGVSGPFRPVGAVRYVELPAGHVATTTHHGAYARLGEAHAAVIGWCRAHGRTLAGVRWEIYGHSGPGDEQPRTDVYYLLAE